jgi:cardiolipin synthase
MEIENLLHWSTLYFLSEWVIRLVMLAVVPWRRSPEAAKGWLLLIFFLPWPGLILYRFIGRPRLPAWRIERREKFGSALSHVTDRLAQHPNIFHPVVSPELTQAVTLAENLGHLPILGGNALELLANYDGTIKRLADDIDAAEHHVHLLFYIFALDATTAKVIDALERAVKRGVKCRVLADSFGTGARLKKLIPKMSEIGVEFHEMMPTGLFRRKFARMDLRNHRKIAVIDGRIAYTGSQNLIDAHFKRGLTYEELMTRVTGPVTLELQYLFATDWYIETGEALTAEQMFPSPAMVGDVPAQAVPSGPGFATRNNQQLIVALIYGARSRVVMTTPYFIPDDSLTQAMQTAVARGVEVHLVVCQIVDQMLVSLAQRSYYEDFLAAGVKIHLYGANFLHAKHLTIDDSVSVIGSSNMDIRSFVLNAEVQLVAYSQSVTRRMTEIEEGYFARSKQLDLDEWRCRPRIQQFAENLARLMSPLL